MRRLACLLLLPLSVACSSPDSGSYPGQYYQPSGSSPGDTASAGSTGSTGSSAPSQPSQPGSTPSPVWHSDAGSGGEPDGQAGVVVPLPVWDSGAGSPSVPLSDDGGAPVTPVSSPPSSDDAGDDTASVLALCAGGINALRGQNDLFQLTISTSLEAQAAQIAASNAANANGNGNGNGNFNGGNNNGFGGEDDFDGQQIDPGASAVQVFNQGLIDEENGEINGENNILDERFSQIGCGVAQTSSGSYWITIEYQ